MFGFYEISASTIVVPNHIVGENVVETEIPPAKKILEVRTISDFLEKSSEGSFVNYSVDAVASVNDTFFIFCTKTVHTKILASYVLIFAYTRITNDIELVQIKEGVQKIFQVGSV